MPPIQRTPTNIQARREPQWGPGNHYRAALSQPIGVGKGEGVSGGCGARAPLSPQKSGKYFSGNYRVKFGHFRENITSITNIIRLRVWGSVVSFPSGVRGRGPAENGFYAYFRSERSHLEHSFQYFRAMAGPPIRRGGRKNSPPLSRQAWLRALQSVRVRTQKTTKIHATVRNSCKELAVQYTVTVSLSLSDI